MGQGTRIDTAAIRAIADRFDSVGQAVDRAAPRGLLFDGSTAGRSHTADGDALRHSLEQFAVGMAVWSRAAAEIATGLRCGADRYDDSDRGAAARIG